MITSKKVFLKNFFISHQLIAALKGGNGLVFFYQLTQAEKCCKMKA